METFCEKYMYDSGHVDDGSTYVYAKVQWEMWLGF